MVWNLWLKEVGVLYDIRIFSQVLKFTVIIAGVAKNFFDVENSFRKTIIKKKLL